jgi:hypothetical protein
MPGWLYESPPPLVLTEADVDAFLAAWHTILDNAGVSE